MFRKNVLYEIVCEGCRGEEKTTKYFGKTARTGYDRGAEHWKSLRTGEKGHFLTKHKEETLHSDFSMRIVRAHPSPLYRQAHEGCLIANAPHEVVLMNGRGDWGQNLPPKIVIESECIAEQQRAILASSMTNAIAYGRAGSGENSGEGGENTENVAQGNLVVIDPPPAPPRGKKRRLLQDMQQNVDVSGEDESASSQTENNQARGGGMTTAYPHP